MDLQPGTEPETGGVPRPAGIQLARFGGVPVMLQPWMLVLVPALGFLVASYGQVSGRPPSLMRIVLGIGVVVAVYLTVFAHEVAHALAARRCRIPVQSITLGAFGGSTALGEEPRTPGQSAFVSVVGPVVSIVIGYGFVLLRPGVNDPWTLQAVETLIWANLFVGLLNLLPALPLDGGQLLLALVWRVTGDRMRATVFTGWAGRIVALALVAAAIVAIQENWQGIGGSYFIAFLFLGVYTWAGSTAAVAQMQIRRRLPELKARPLARGVIAVPEDLSINEAVRRAQEEHAGGIVVHTSDERVTGVVSEAALAAVPLDRRPWVPVSTVMRSIEDGLILPADIAGEDLVRAISRTPADEYVLIDEDGEIFGLLSTADVDRAFAETRGRRGRSQAATTDQTDQSTSMSPGGHE